MSDVPGAAGSGPGQAGIDRKQVREFAEEFLSELKFSQGVDTTWANANDVYMALGLTVRKHLMERWLRTIAYQVGQRARVVCYLSAEYLLGRQLDSALLNAGLTEVAEAAMAELGMDFEELRALEVEPGLGNGGLGRLAACFIDSLASMEIPAVGYGIRYEYGIFVQTFVDGWQVEQPDRWLFKGCPWELPQPEMAVEVGFGGHCEEYTDDQGRPRVRWHPERTVLGIPYNYMVPGYRSSTVNTLRLWSARSTQDFDLTIFNAGDYVEAVRGKVFSENISKVLYPEDSTPQGKELRLQQQYFFVACSIRDFLTQVFDRTSGGWDSLPDRVVFQLNDTHPVIAIPELMRVLMDEEGLEFEHAFDITRRCFAYTCHTLLPEALERWPTDLLERLLPRHLQIIFSINQHFLDDVRVAHPGDESLVRRLSIVGDWPERQVRMAHLATVGSFRVNGVAELHSELLRTKVLTDFSAYWPEKFTNITNGVTPRRFMRLSNPPMCDLITEAIGDGWLSNLDRLSDLEPYAEDAEFRRRWRDVKRGGKARLAGIIATECGFDPGTEPMYDVMVKRLHEYKRQLLKVLHIITLYHRIKDDPSVDVCPRLVVFGAKAAPGYRMAKLTIRLINAVAQVVNNDQDVAGRIRIAFIPNYNVTLAERIMPAADLSEQISMAGKEASGTGNMKLTLNGALTVGTLDGANVEIHRLVGEDHFFLFGLTEEEAAQTWAEGYHPGRYYQSDPRLHRILDDISSGHFLPSEPWQFVPVVESLLGHDQFMHLADYASYVEVQDRIEQRYADVEGWSRSSIINVGRCGFFSSDRSIGDYLERVWQAEAVPVPE